MNLRRGLERIRSVYIDPSYAIKMDHPLKTIHKDATFARSQNKSVNGNSYRALDKGRV